jgi:hypothetical protein
LFNKDFSFSTKEQFEVLLLMSGTCDVTPPLKKLNGTVLKHKKILFKLTEEPYDVKKL